MSDNGIWPATAQQPTAFDDNRTTKYQVAGVAPYGFLGTWPYSPKGQWVPNLDTPPGGQPEVALYERIDWSNAVSGNADSMTGISNPPFMGIGSSMTQIPGWMSGKDGAPAQRILRGYIRRVLQADLTKIAPIDDKEGHWKDLASNARLYFMYNPSDIQRQYLSFADTSNLQSINPSATQNADLPAFTALTVSLELFFDRQEEVGRFPDHPGVLIDLATFDALMDQRPLDQGTVNKQYDWYKSHINQALATSADGTGATPTYFQTLTLNNAIQLAVIMSPNITFQGSIMEANALFQKFSSRMTPTRMTLSLTLLLTYIGRKLDPVSYVGKDYRAALQKQRDLGNLAAAVDPNKLAGSNAAANSKESQGRAGAVQWAELWTADSKKHFNNTQDPNDIPAYYYRGLYGVPYSQKYRCDNWGSADNKDGTGDGDSNLFWGTADDSPDHKNHQPGWFDCSSLVWRAYNVFHWCDKLGMGTDCGPTSSETIWLAAIKNDNVWNVGRIGVVQDKVWYYPGFGATGQDLSGQGRESMPSAHFPLLSPDEFNYWTVPANQRPVSGGGVGSGTPADPNRHGPDVGDILIKGGDGTGNGSDGHAAMIDAFVSTNADPNQWTWKLISIGHAAKSDADAHSDTSTVVHVYQVSTHDIQTSYDWILRPGPIGVVPNAPDSKTGTSW